MKNYVIISPVKDEEKFVKLTIESVINQTIRPSQYIIVNDGSTDNTEKIVGEYTRIYPWIKLINRKDGGKRLPGKGIVEAFYEGFHSISNADWEYIVKLDSDLSFSSEYFEKIFEEFEKNPKLGIASGKTYIPINGDVNNLQIEATPKAHTRGASKIYKRQCFEDIGGIKPLRGWDTIDDISAMLKGYEVRSYKERILVHYRPMGSIEILKNWKKFSRQHGIDYYQLGYHPLFMIIKSIKFAFVRKPRIIFAINMLYHYFKASLSNKEKLVDREFIRKLREIQLKRMLLQKVS